MVVCMEQGADLRMAQLMPLALTVFCFSKIHIGSTFLVLAHPCGPGKKAIKHVCVYVGNTVLSASHTHTYTRLTALFRDHPAPHRSVFYRPDALPVAQQRQNTKKH